MTTLRAAVLGCGFQGTAIAKTLAASEFFDLVGVSDIDAASAGRAARLTGTEMIGAGNLSTHVVDVVFIATPSHLHFEQALAAIDEGINVFIEKPMALETSECKLLSQAAASAGVKLVVGHILRTLPGILRLKKLVDSGALGAIENARAENTRFFEPDATAASWWKQDPAKSGGELMHELHMLDLLCWLLGTPTSVNGVGDLQTSRMLLTFDDGLIASYESSSRDRFPKWSLELQGTEASARIDMRASTLTIQGAGGTRDSGLFDSPADDSLREPPVPTAGYNLPGSPRPLWMDEALQIEVQSVGRFLSLGETSPLAQTPEVAVAAIRSFQALSPTSFIPS